MLNLIPENEFIYILGKEDVDVWGIGSPSDLKIKKGCLIKPSEDATPIESKGGKQIKPSYEVTFNGKVALKVGDFIEVEDEVFIVLHRKEIKDLSRNVILTKITV